MVGDTRGLGLAIGVVPLYDYDTNVLRIQPPLAIPESELGRALDVMEDCLRHALQGR